MKNMKKYCAVLLIFAAILCTACSKSNVGTGGEAETVPILDRLSKEQIEYLTEQLFLTTDAISEMSYEGVNYHLLGTGMELYNQTSGVEINGLDYTVDKEIDFENLKPVTGKKLTYDEAYSIRLKEKDMRLEDFLEYEFICNRDKENVYRFMVPLKDCEDTCVRFSVKTDGTNIHISTPHFFYSENLSAESSVGSTFSILYDTLLFKDFFKDNKHDNEGVLIGIRYNSATPTSIALLMYNFTGKKFSCNKSFDIYRGEGDGKELLEEFSVKTKEKQNVDANTTGTLYLTFGSTKKLEPGIYTIVLDKGVFEGSFEVKA